MKWFNAFSASILAALAAILSGCSSMGTQVWIPMESEGNKYNLQATLYVPEGKTSPHPVVIFSHGSWYPDSRQIAANYHGPIDFFVERGYAVIYVYRRGYARSEGQNNEPLCRGDTNESGLRAAVRDVQATLEYVKKNAALDSSRIILAGHSRGGLLSTMVAAFTPHEGIRGVVSFAGGWTNCFRVFNHDALRYTSDGRKVYNLWLYSQGDTFVNETHARAYADTFTQAGGRLDLKLYPPGAGGHSIYEYPSNWKDDVQRFLERVVK